MSDIDLRGTQGAVVLPGGTVTQNYPEPAMTQTTNGDKAMHERVYNHSEQLAALNVRMSYIEAMLSEIKSLLQRQQLLLAVTVVVVLVALIFWLNYSWL